MRIAVLILYTQSWQDIADVVIPNARKYCEKRGYDLRESVFVNEFSGFKKLEKIQELFNEGYDIVCSLDCDTLITNHNVSVEDFIDLDRHSLLYISNDYNGVNAGVFIVVNDYNGNQLINDLIDFKKIPNVYCEQDAIREYLRMYGDDVIKIIPQKEINSYLYENYPEIPPQKHEQGQWEEGDFILHLPGVGQDLRKQILSSTKIIE